MDVIDQPPMVLAGLALDMAEQVLKPVVMP
jgi:hypothetical protein